MLDFSKRLQVAGVHFFLTLSILIFPLLMVTKYFYPGVFFGLDGGIEALKIAFVVDLVLGPLLVFLVYKTDKKHFYKDVLVIVLFQIIAVGFAFYTMYNVRPVAFVFDEKAFFSVSRKQITDEYEKSFKEQVLKNNGTNFPNFTVKLPSDLKEKRQLAEEMGKSGRPFYINTNLWDSNVSSSVCMNVALINKLKTSEAKIMAEKMSTELLANECLVMAQLRFGQAIMVFDKTNGLILDKYKKVNLGHLLED